MQSRSVPLRVSAAASESIMASHVVRASSSQERTAEVWRLAKTGNINNLKLERQKMTPVQQKEVRVDVKSVRPAPTDHMPYVCMCGVAPMADAEHSDCA